MILPRILLSSAGFSSVVQLRNSAAKTDLYSIPDGAQPDLVHTFNPGHFVKVSWNGRLNDSISDLWVVAYNYEDNSFAELLAGEMNSSTNTAHNHRLPC